MNRAKRCERNGAPPEQVRTGGDFGGLGMKKGGADKGKATNAGKIGARLDRKDLHSRAGGEKDPSK